MLTKKCSDCGSEKPLEEFPPHSLKNGTLGYRSYCRECKRTRWREWAKTSEGKATKRRGRLRIAFGITEEDYQRMHADQKAVCAICGQPETKVHHAGTPLKLSVDHNHTTGAVRSLLCSSCNVGLGSFFDDPSRLIEAARYLINHERKAP
jgi:hypothetical protein